jgi:hypothetical protein
LRVAYTFENQIGDRAMEQTSDAKAGSEVLEGRAKLVESDLTNDSLIQWQDRIGLEMRIS